MPPLDGNPASPLPCWADISWSALEKEEKRLAAGWTYEPDTFYEKNAAALSLSDAKANAERATGCSRTMGYLQSNGGVTMLGNAGQTPPLPIISA